LERGEQSSGEVVRVDAEREFPVGMQGSECIADDGCPLIEPCRDERSGLGVTLGELAAERAKWAAPFASVSFAAVITMFRQASTPFALLSTRPW
jgi:hypothetical protein